MCALPAFGFVRYFSISGIGRHRKAYRRSPHHGIQEGQEVSPFYDPMIAKVIAFGDNRAEAIRRLASAVQDTKLLGMNNNKLFLQNVLRHEVFGAGEATTAFIEQHFSADVSTDQKAPSSA